MTKANPTLITKRFALDKFINERILGDQPLAVNGYGKCVYDPAFYGGCAIGCLIPKGMYDPEMDHAGAVRELFNEYSSIKALFEDPESPFWDNLQLAHDKLYLYGEYLLRNPEIVAQTTSALTEHQTALRWAADLC